jgi:glycosyltransferase involved in cell wall biosynthesis
LKTLLIIDPTLKSFEGHSWNYDRAIFESCLQIFPQVELFSDRRFDVGTADIPVHAVLNRIDMDLLKRWSNTLFSRLLPTRRAGNERHASVAAETPSVLLRAALWLRQWDLAQRVETILKAGAGSGPQHVLFQHAFISELLLARKWLGRRDRSRLCFHLILRYSPSLIKTDQLGNEQFGGLLRAVTSASTGNTRLYTDSERVAYEFRRDFNVSVTTLPIPVRLNHSAGLLPQSTSTREVTLGFLGSPRTDKGFDHLPSLLEQLPAMIGGRRIVALVQITRTSPDPRVRKAVARLRELMSQGDDAPGPRVELVEGPAPTEEYFSWFSRASVIVLPYVSEKYASSTSGILVEALLMGVPVIVRGNSWMGDQVIEARNASHLVVGELFDTSQGLHDAVERVTMSIDEYRHSAAKYRSVFSARHNPSRWCDVFRSGLPD